MGMLDTIYCRVPDLIFVNGQWRLMIAQENTQANINWPKITKGGPRGINLPPSKLYVTPKVFFPNFFPV